eukprot:jgi/Tetstr1/433573/TSEL_022840.t1
MGDATPAQLEFMDGELARFLAVGAWERGYCAKWVSRLFLVPKPGTNKWRLIIDLRPLNRYYGTPIFRRRFGLRMLPYMDDFLFLARTQAEAIWQRDYIERHLSGFGLLRNPNKGVWEPTQKLVHLGREVDCDDWQFNPRRFASLTAKWGACTIDRFATSENALLPRYNARWRDPRCEAVDALRLSDAAWRCERNWCNPPWNLIGDLVSKLESSGAPAIVIVPYWPDKAWYQLLSEMCSDMRSWKPRHDLFIPGRTGDRLPVGAPRWPVVAFNIPARDPRPWPAAPGIF